jgi:hypothetical protein
MTSDWPAHTLVPRTEPLRTHAELLAAEAQQKAHQRQLELEELRSDLNSAERRVRTWEKLHGLSLPRDPDHPILDLIASKTRLTLQEVQDVQRDDAARCAARSPAAKP